MTHHLPLGIRSALAALCRLLPVAVIAAGLPISAAGATDVADEEEYQSVMYTALCRGILWPDDAPTLLASDGLPADVALEMATRDLLVRAAERAPEWADDLSAEAAAGSVWRAGVRDIDPDLFRHVGGECRIHLEAEIFGPR